jgi:hypothetical protein
VTYFIEDSLENARALAKEGILGKGRRLSRKGGVVDYTTGQSFNEEMLNMMDLGASKGKRSFFQVQSKWMDKGYL